jgi:predicted amidophosphoribosyltransferase
MADASPSHWMNALPSRCAVCGAWPARPVCERCVQCFGQPRHRCRSCGLPLPDGVAVCGACVREPPPLDALPLPLASLRLAERGFNQALLLARALARAKADSGLLLRLRETGSQTALDRNDRRANVRDAFGIEPMRAAELRGKAVLLVDDVMTSGASLHAAAEALRHAGAQRVAAVVLARTEQDGDSA